MIQHLKLPRIPPTVKYVPPPKVSGPGAVYRQRATFKGENDHSHRRPAYVLATNLEIFNMNRAENRGPIRHAPMESHDIKKETPRRTCSWSRKLEIAIKSMGVVAFLLSCVALWPTMASASDTKLATSLAKWTSMKDFMEFCESHQFNTSDCVLVRNMTLSPPPGFANLNARNWILGAEMSLNSQLKGSKRGSDILILIKFLYPLVGFLTILRYVKHRYPRYKRAVSSHIARFSNNLAVHSKKKIVEAPDGQGTGARHVRAGLNGSGSGSRRRRILRSRNSGKRGNSMIEEMDDSSSDELLYARQTGFASSEMRRMTRIRLRRRTVGSLRE